MNLYIRPIGFLSLCLLFFAMACKPLAMVHDQANYYKMETLEESDTSIEEMIQPYKQTLEVEMGTVIGQATGSLTKAQPESTLGNFVADAMLSVSNELYDGKVDIAISNYGGLRILEIPKGPISRGRIFELMPFDNTLVVLEMNKSQLTEFYEHFGKMGGWPISAGVEMALDSVNYKVDLLLNGEPLQNNRTYGVCISDYIANGGDQCEFLKEIPQVDIKMLFRDALLKYVEETKIIEPVLENRCHF